MIDAVDETHPTNQYIGDVWGLYLAIEHTDGPFLDERGLPDGNTYKIENGSGMQRHQGATLPIRSIDYNELKAGYNRAQPIEWWRSNVDLDVYFSFRSTNRGVNNMDLREGWNICMYHNSVTDLWSVIPWDLDMLYMPVTHWSGVMNFQNALSQHAALAVEYRNRAREVRDLLFTTDQVGQLVDQLAFAVNPPARELTLVDVDEAMWNFHSRAAGGHRGAFYRNPSTHNARGGTVRRTLVSADLEGFAQWIKDFTVDGYGGDFLTREGRDTQIPETPTIEAIGDAGFPVDDLAFRSSAFRDPQGDDTFGAVAWRVAEVVGERDVDPTVAIRDLPYEIRPVWESGEIVPFADAVVVPPEALAVGSTYRVRCRMKDATGRWSHWSDAIEFTATAPTAEFPQQMFLRISELHYHPSEDEEHEFVELINIGLEPLDLSPVAFRDGVGFEFGSGDATVLAPGERVVVVKDRQVFTARYGDDVLIAGEYDGRLSNGGERIALVYGRNVPILVFEYDDDWYPQTDGLGHSLVIRDATAPPEAWNLWNAWRESAEIGGSPGREDSEPGEGGERLPGDIDGDSRLTITDTVRLLMFLFRGDVDRLPCDGATIAAGGNVPLADFDGSGSVGLTDAIGILDRLFRQGPPHALGEECVPIVGCQAACAQ